MRMAPPAVARITSASRSRRHHDRASLRSASHVAVPVRAEREKANEKPEANASGFRLCFSNNFEPLTFLIIELEYLIIIILPQYP